jgi:hypothetical protein
VEQASVLFVACGPAFQCREFFRRQLSEIDFHSHFMNLAPGNRPDWLGAIAMRSR